MTHISTPKLLDSNQFSFKVIQASRIYDLIQQNISDPRTVLNGPMLSEFIYWLNPHTKKSAVQLLHQIDSIGQQMNYKHFGQCIAIYLKQQHLSVQQDLLIYHRNIKAILLGEYQKTLDKVDQWDKDQNLTQEACLQKKLNIEMFKNQLSPYIGSMQQYAFDNSLQKVNYCLSIITLSPYLQKAQITSCYRIFSDLNVLRHLSTCLMKLQAGQFDIAFLIEKLKCLSYFYQALSFPQIRQKLKNCCLFYSQSWHAIANTFNCGNSKIRQQVAILIALISRNIPEFCDYVLEHRNVLLLPLCGNISSLSEKDGLFYSLQFLINLMKRYKLKPIKQYQMNSQNIEIVKSIYEFALGTLSSSNMIENQEYCLLLIAQCLKSYQLTEKELTNLSVINNVFSTFNLQLVRAALKILQVAIVFHLDDIKNMILQDAKFIEYIKHSINDKHTSQSLHCTSLHILYLLSQGDNLKYFMEKQLIEDLLVLANYKFMSTLSIVGEILFNLIQASLQFDWMLSCIYQKNLLIYLAQILNRCFQSDQIIQIFMQNTNLPNYLYINRHLFVTFFKSIYCLAVGVSRKDKKYSFSERINPTFIELFFRALQFFFGLANQHFIVHTLKQRVKLNIKRVKLDNGIQVFKMISIIIQEMTYNMQGKSPQLLKYICQLRKLYYSHLYSHFKIHQLEVDNIPIMINLSITIGDKTIQRSIPHKYDFASTKTYLKEFVAKERSITTSIIKDLIIQCDHGEQLVAVANQSQYRALVSKILDNWSTSKFCLNLIVRDIKEKGARENFAFLRGGINQNLGQTTFGNQGRRFNTMIQNQNQDIRRTYSPFIAKNRTIYEERVSRSPKVYGNHCKGCGMRTANKFYCQNCNDNGNHQNN